MRLARSGAPLKCDVILLSEADEEGGSYGTRWLADNHWDKIDAGVSLNEGGWIFKDSGGRLDAQLAAAARQRDPPVRAGVAPDRAP